MINIQAYSVSTGIQMSVTGRCDGSAHSGTETCPALGGQTTIAAGEVERLGVGDALDAGMRRILDEHPNVLSRVWC